MKKPKKRSKVVAKQWTRWVVENGWACLDIRGYFIPTFGRSRSEGMNEQMKRVSILKYQEITSSDGSLPTMSTNKLVNKSDGVTGEGEEK